MGDKNFTNKLRIYVFAAAVLVATSILFSSFYLRREWFVVDAISLNLFETSTSNSLMTHFQSELKSKLDEYAHRPLWSVSLSEIQTTLIREGWVEEFEIDRKLPNQVEVELRPKPVIGIYVNDKGLFFPMVHDRVLKKHVNPSLAPDVPIVRGEWARSSMDLKLAALSFLKESANENKKWFSSQNLKEVFVDDEEGVSVELYQPEVKVILGTDASSAKLQRLQHVIEYVEQNRLQGRVIDSTFSKKVLVRLRKGS